MSAETRPKKKKDLREPNPVEACRRSRPEATEYYAGKREKRTAHGGNTRNARTSVTEPGVKASPGSSLQCRNQDVAL